MIIIALLSENVKEGNCGESFPGQIYGGIAKKVNMRKKATCMLSELCSDLIPTRVSTCRFLPLNQTFLPHPEESPWRP